jgi:phage portal protein BeeE
VDITLAPWLTAIEQRLSLGDVTPRGTQLRLDVEAFMRGTQLERWQAWQIAVNIGALSPADVAKRESYTPAATVPEMPTPAPAQLAAP